MEVYGIMPLTIGLNITSLLLQRQLGEHTDRMQTTLSRLSSGQRINSSSDDPAGQAIAKSLNADARVYTQGIRNLNDGISLLNVAEGALNELSSISKRQAELAQQAANGSYSSKQRLAMHMESVALTEEFNRILVSTKFNGISLLDGSGPDQISLQAGYGSNGTVDVSTINDFLRTAGDGTFTSSTTIGGAPGGSYDMATGDFNGDGHLDVAVAAWTGGTWVSLGNGDGTFGAPIATAGLAQTKSIEVADINGDGRDDIVSLATGGISVLLSDGDGTFTNSASFSPIGTFNHSLSLGDFNGDGKYDFVAQDSPSGDLYLYTGNGDGTFSAGQNIGNAWYGYGSACGDINRDGKDDLVIGTLGGTYAFVSQANGTFAKSQIATGDSRSVALADLDGDGYLDVMSGILGTRSMKVLMGSGTGTFTQTGDYAFNTGLADDTYQRMTTGDFNGDGLADVAISTRESGTPNGAATIFINNGDGTFQAATHLGALNDSISIVNGDYNSDGVNDILIPATWNSVRLFTGDTQQLTTAPYQDLTTVESARLAIETSTAQIERVASALGQIGAHQSRLSIAVNNLESTVANYRAAESRIMDVDVAEETANLVKLKILQQITAALLGQANINAKLAVELLKPPD